MQGLSALLDKGARNREIDEELQAFMDASVDDKMAHGMSREAALRATLVEAGHAELIKHKV